MEDFRSLRKLAGYIFLITMLECSIVGCSSPLNQNKDKSNKISIQDIDHMKPKVKEEVEKLTIDPIRLKNQQDNERVPLMKPSSPVRAIYVSSYVANSQRMNELIKTIDRTELNAMVLDLNSGIQFTSVGYRNNTPIFVASSKRSAVHFRQVIQKLKNDHIYLIARIIVFKDSALGSQVPSWTLKHKNGNVWKDQSGSSWIDPYRQEAWEYKFDLADYAAELGFDEVQYDYVRFPDNSAKVDMEVAYANTEGWTKGEAIRQFLHRANIRSHKKGIRISADVFGMVGSSSDDMGIGQSWNLIAKEVDVISPMIYPSHYSKGTWGIDNPDLSAGTIITHALRDAAKYNKKLNNKGIKTAEVRPWLQAFTARWVHPHQKYGSIQINEQIQAARKAGFQSYMLWNSSSRYPLLNR